MARETAVDDMATALALLGVIATTAYLISLVRWAYFSPLSKVPNAHFTAPFSIIWSRWLKLTMQETGTRRRLHRRLGPVIRMAPNELSIDCIDGGVRTVYGGGFEKPIWYSQDFWNYGVPPLFAMRSTAQHSQRRHAMTGLYTKSYILKSIEMSDILTRVIGVKFAERLASWASSGMSVDVVREAKAMSLDVVSAHSFGAEHGFDLVQHDSKKRMVTDAFADMLDTGPVRHHLAELTEYFPRVSSWSVPSTAKQARALAENLVQELAQASTSTSCLASYLRSRLSMDKASDPLLEPHIQSEALDHMIAANEGISITLSFLMHELSLRPAWQSKLREELLAIDTASPAATAVALDALPLLDAILDETLRLRPAAKGPFPRVVPPAGARIGAFPDIPGGTIVSASAYTLGLHAEVFGPRDPEAWAPERWLEAEPARRTEMRRWMWAFGSGSRGCIGVHLAVRIMKTFIATVYRDYKTVIVDDEGFWQIDAVIAAPASGKLMLRFEKV